MLTTVFVYMHSLCSESNINMSKTALQSRFSACFHNFEVGVLATQLCLHYG